jgi:hypothetical protein
MTCISKQLPKWQPMIAACALLWSAAASAYDLATEAALSLLNQIAHTQGALGLAEPVQSLGSMGFQVGIGSKRSQSTEDELKFREMLGLDTENLNDSQTAYMTVAAGLPWPVNFGAVLGINPALKTMVAGFNMDAMIWERFLWPSLGFRLKGQTLHGSESAAYDEVSMLASTSYGYRFLTGYVGYEATKSRLRYRPSSPAQLALLSSTPSDTRYHSMAILHDVIAGIRLQIIPGSTMLTAELTDSLKGQQSLNLKLSLLL